MTSLPPPSSPLFLRLQYFLYFGVLGVYLPYFNLYCYHLDFSGAQIGFLSGLRSATLVIFPFVWGMLADRLARRKSIYLLCNLMAALIWSAFLFTRSFTPMLLITGLYGIFYAPLISFLEAYSMDILGEDKKAYGRVRLWGSISFIVVVAALGPLIDRLGITVIIPLILAGAFCQTAGALKLPAISPPAKRREAMTSALEWRRVAVFLTCGFLMLVSHGTYYGFFSIHLEQTGRPSTFIGIAWAVAVAAEIAVMFYSRRLFERVSLEKVLLFSFLMAALRWALLYLFTAPGVILATQILHACTYGTFHMASIIYMDRLTPAGAKTFGQAANNAITYGLGLMVGFLLNGALFERLATRQLFLASALVALAAGGLFLAGQMRLTRPEPRE
ncbi:MAG: MFS transporter [Desulfobacterales bacterium]|nr:MFS transporter [Desulfobacterales bacterium]MDJ0854127.1 MFS transporter [Desulfobacterales bacterium]MDJ0990720.1 MFS transporter [Desulfobacterales bacterium]